jgi:hypothetical protein
MSDLGRRRRLASNARFGREWGTPFRFAPQGGDVVVFSKE